jgi:hypothetical protein
MRAACSLEICKEIINIEKSTSSLDVFAITVKNDF